MSSLDWPVLNDTNDFYLSGAASSAIQEMDSVFSVLLVFFLDVWFSVTLTGQGGIIESYLSVTKLSGMGSDLVMSEILYLMPDILTISLTMQVVADAQLLVVVCSHLLWSPCGLSPSKT